MGGKDRLISDKADIDTDRETLIQSKRQLQQKSRDLFHEYEAKLGDKESALTKLNAENNLAKREQGLVTKSLAQAHEELAEARANVHTLEDRLASQGLDVERYWNEQKRVVARLKAAEDQLKVYQTETRPDNQARLAEMRREIVETEEILEENLR